jgi:TRAP-type C4-dicarboxylate transport system substrate-binding protein
MKKLLGLSALAGVAFASNVAMAGEKWDMPMAYADSNYHTQNGKLFAKAVGICTGGELEIVVHGGGSLFKGGEIKRAVQTGQAPIGERLLSAHQNENAIFGVDSVPFLASSFDNSDKLYAAARPTMEKILDKQNMVLLYGVPWPPQGMYFKKEINGVADMKGIKFRAYNAATARLAELGGMLPVQIEAAELSQALATGVAEAFISSGSTGYDRKVWEHLSHFYDTQAWLPRNYVFANKDAYNGLRQQGRL